MQNSKCRILFLQLNKKGTLSVPHIVGCFNINALRFFATLRMTFSINCVADPNLLIILYSLFIKKIKTPVLLDRRFWFVSALPIFPGRFQPSIFGVNELNYRVRDGNGWTLITINTDSRNCSSRERKRYSNRTKHKLQVFFCDFMNFVEI